MPLFFNKIISNEIHFTLWKITESLEALQKDYELELEYLAAANEIVNETKRIEFLVGKVAIKAACFENNIPFTNIIKDEHGKPFLQNSEWQMSISHTLDFVGVVLRKDKALGIDIERPQKKMLKVLNRLCTPSEIEIINGNLDYASIIWSSKESLYKLYGKRKVDFKENLFIEKRGNKFIGNISMPDYKSEHEIYIEKIEEYFVVIVF